MTLQPFWWPRCWLGGSWKGEGMTRLQARGHSSFGHGLRKCLVRALDLPMGHLCCEQERGL